MDLTPVRMLYATLAPEAGIGMLRSGLLKVRYGWFASRLQYLGFSSNVISW